MELIIIEQCLVKSGIRGGEAAARNRSIVKMGKSQGTHTRRSISKMAPTIKQARELSSRTFGDACFMLPTELVDILQILDLEKKDLLLERTKKWLAFASLHEIYNATKGAVQMSEDIKSSKYHYLHQWLESCEIQYPTPEVPPRNQALEARIKKLRAQQEEREYRQMTANVRKETSQGETFSIGAEVRSLRSQIFAVMNMLLTVGGTFVFGYKAVEYSAGQSSVPLQILVGLVMATIVALAEFYFVAKVI